MKRFSLLLIFALHGFYAFSQSVLSGTIVDMDSNGAVPYVSIGITGKPIGTVANNLGVFDFLLNDQLNDRDTIKFSSIGYESKGFTIGELRERSKTAALIITLKRSLSQLKQVVVLSKKVNVKIVGYERNSMLFGVSFGSSQVGSQGGIIIPIKHSATSLESLSFLIIKNSFKHLVFRMNLYEMVKDKPGSNILTENIFLTVDNNQTGKMTFSLTKYDLVFNKDILMTLEWIEAQPANNGNFAIAAALFGHSYFRQASQSPWIRKGTGLGISVKTIY
jgi:hypothetical protein